MRRNFIGTGFEHIAANAVESARNTIGKVSRQFLNVSEPQTEEERLLSLIRKAQNDWKNAEMKFNETTDEAMMDHTIYDMMAAQSRYTYLIHEAKRLGIHV